MATIQFYEKPGCANNARQKRLLLDAGHELIVHNLLETRWNAEELRLFFGRRPLSEWFNRAAPRIKSGEVVPESLDPETAIALMLEDPLLIRRPLLQSGEKREAGFDPERVREWLDQGSSVEIAPSRADLETCQRIKPCPLPGSPQND